MDPRQQPPLAPLRALDARREAAAQCEALVLQRRQGEVDVALR